ncbi:hypothetical protein DL89DRAFT_270318 [Linderina pennispora]|uniref:HMA domain-containing protein n=1 Tax=Linderina pennispora TaxID=61395 RepID=A0A1Y1VXX8_9FUNG|nr:uncharacterized protein DL89DRAFT_270318 [Linderina pennispora]ORX66129.1 hypothetical protein DL89DRAFT_270318 [Linderina pennispora]
MSCSGCSGARVEGIDKYEVSLEKQRVSVTTDLPRETIFEAIKKTGKPVKDAPTA